MRFTGCVLLISGWLLAVASLVVLAGLAQRFAFLTCGVLVEVLGLALVAQHHRSLQRGPE